jgi:hypothetical protein
VSLRVNAEFGSDGCAGFVDEALLPLPGVLEVGVRVDLSVADPQLEVCMRSRALRIAGIAHVSDHLTRMYRIALFEFQRER